MNKTLLVIKKEIVTTAQRKSFLFTTFGLPLIAVLIILGVSALNQESRSTLSEFIGSPGSEELESEGLVDRSGLIETIPEELPPNVLVAFPDEESARQALAEGEVSGYYIVPEDVVETGEIISVREDANPLSDRGQPWFMDWALRYNLLGGDAELAARVQNPMNLEEVALEPSQVRDKENPLTYWIPYGTTMMFYIIILGSASLLLSSVTNEKQNQVIEILMLSVSPMQMLSGKILALGLLGLLQTVIWAGTSYSLLSFSGRTFTLPAGLGLSPTILVWGVIFFLLGYAVYASLMAGLGALVPNLQEASQATFVIIAPLIVPLLFVNILIEDPHGAVSTILSIFPLTAPVTMMTRLAAGGVPLWQPLVAIALLVGTAFLIVRAVANLFHAQTLLSGAPFSVRRFLGALLGRV